MTSTHGSGLSVAIRHAEHLIGSGLLCTLREVGGLDVAVAGNDRDEDERSAAQVLITDHEEALRVGARRRRAQAGPALMVVSACVREQDVRLALQAGVRGYVHSNCGLPELLACLRAVAAGSRYLCSVSAQRMADSLTHEALTAREMDVLLLLVRGHSNKVIARSLAIAVGTVKAHVKAILAKLDVRTRTHAVTVAVDRGLIPGSALPNAAEASPPAPSASAPARLTLLTMGAQAA